MAATREDCWSEEATHSLIEAWGERFLDMNRGNLRQQDWQEIANSVNAIHGRCPKTFRTEIQCKNRIDTIKKKFKSEKAKVDESNGGFKSSWRFYQRVEFLIGSSLKYLSRNAPRVSVSPPHPRDYSRSMIPFDPLVIGKGKEPMETPMPGSVVASGSGLKRSYAVMAAAAAAEEREEAEEVNEEENEDGLRSLAKAVEGLGKVYERVERMKMKQMVDLEKERIKFAKNLEVQRMRMFVDMQVELEKATGKRVMSGGSANGMALAYWLNDFED